MNCLTGIINIKSYCAPSAPAPFVEEYIDLNKTMLDHLADESELTGSVYAAELISAAQSHVETDLALVTGEVATINSAVVAYINTCKFGTQYTNAGSVLVNYMRTSYAVIRVRAITFKANFDGAFQITIDDSSGTLVTVDAVAENGKEITVACDYTTTKQNVKFYCADNTKSFALTSCGATCGSCAAKRGNYLQIGGWNGASMVNVPVGFIPNAYVSCNVDQIYCMVVDRYKAIFAKAIAYKVGEMAYNRLLISPRINDTTLNVDRDAAVAYLNTLVGKYRELMHGTATAYGNAATIGIKQLVSQTLKTLSDKCVSCGSQVTTATATF